ncbi:MAG TPA: DinB family protein [Candidatus Dormibacteraeota bacterium]|nr:DinB family protein [Candidatus Dormibacteraeota bacterium]
MATMAQPTITQPMLSELHEEAAITRRALDRVPEDKLTWKPHPKSMTLGQLASHVASIPGGIARMVQQESFDVAQRNFVPPQPNTLQEILVALEQSVRDAEQCLQEMSDDRANGPWRLMRNGKEIFTMPRVAVVRTIMLNHWYHHRGQLSVYLRLLDIPVPVIYGRSADEDPLA